MRFMVMVRSDKNSEAGILPSTELLEAMGKYNEELVKAGVLPECVHARRQVAFAASAAERGNVLVADLVGGERLRQRMLVVLRIGARAWQEPDVDQNLDPRLAQEPDEFGQRTRGVADGVKRLCRAPPRRRLMRRRVTRRRAAGGVSRGMTKSLLC